MRCLKQKMKQKNQQKWPHLTSFYKEKRHDLPSRQREPLPVRWLLEDQLARQAHAVHLAHVLCLRGHAHLRHPVLSVSEREEHEISVKWHFLFAVTEVKPLNCN